MDVHPGRPFYTTITNFGKAHISLCNRKKIGEVAPEPREICYVKDKHFSYPIDAEGIKSDRHVNAVY